MERLEEDAMTELPEPYRRFMEEFPQVGDAYNSLGSAAHEGGPLDQKSRQLIKLALAIGAGREGAVHSHTRRSLEMDIAPEEIKHVVLLAITTLGFPAAMSAYTWVNDELDKL
jgi:alkylhydroperoxidase/carboxymuconolactone decarboxylase family protein YurZ